MRWLRPRGADPFHQTVLPVTAVRPAPGAEQVALKVVARRSAFQRLQPSPHLSTGAAAQVHRLPPILRPCPDRGSDTGPATLFRHPMPNGASHTSPGCKPWESARKRNPRSEGTPHRRGTRTSTPPFPTHCIADTHKFIGQGGDKSGCLASSDASYYHGNRYITQLPKSYVILCILIS